MPKKLTRLTAAQKSRFSEYVDRYTKIGLCCDEADWETFEDGVKRCYKFAGLEPPKAFIRVESPIVLVSAAWIAAMAIELYRQGEIKNPKKAVDSAVGSEVRSAVYWAVYSAVRSAVDSAVGWAVGSAVGSEVRSEVDSAVGSAVRSAVGSEVDSAVRSAVGSEVNWAVHLAVRSAVDSAVGWAVGSEVDSAVRSAVGSEVGSEVNWAVRSEVDSEVRAVGSAIRSAVGSAVGSAVRSAVHLEVCSAVRSAVDSAVGSAVGSAVRSAVDLEVGLEVGSAVGSAVGSEVDSAVDSAVHSAVRSLYYRYIGGQFWVSWQGFCAFLREVCDLEIDIWDREKAYADAQTSAGWWWPHKDFVMVCNRPEFIKRDEQGRLHSDCGMSIRFRDGWGLFHWHGVAVKEEIILAPSKITAPQILGEANAEVRRIMIERVGMERFIAEAKAKAIHSHDRGTLFSIDLPGDPEQVLRVVRVKCPSTGHEYFLRVPPQITRADDAVAWSFGFDLAKQYAPVEET